MPKNFVESKDDRRVVVGWQRGQDAQIGVTTPGERSVFWQLLTSGDGAPDAVDHRRVIEVAKSISDVVQRYPIPTTWSDLSEEQEGADVLGQAILNRLDSLAFAEGTGGEGPAVGLGSLWFWFEDRRQVNDLIRLLRHARDEAFGKDE